MCVPPRRGVYPLRRIRWPLSGCPISQSKDRLLCVPGRSEMAPPMSTESSEFNPPLQPLFKQSTEPLGLGREKKSIGRRLHCKRQLDQWVTRSHILDPFLLHFDHSSSGEKTASSGAAFAEETDPLALVPSLQLRNPSVFWITLGQRSVAETKTPWSM